MAVASAWSSLPLVLVAFLATRYVLQGPLPLAIAQVIYVGSALAAAVFVWSAAYRAAPGSRGRIVWRLLALSLGALTVSEAVYAYELMTDGAAGMAGTLGADALNGVAALLFVAMLGAGSSVDRLGRLAATRLIIDLTATSTLVFAVLFRVLVAGLGATEPAAVVFDATRYAVYASIGFLIIAGGAMLGFSMPASRSSSWDRLLAIGVGLFGFGVSLWPAWNLAVIGESVPAAVQVIVSCLYLLAYQLIAIAGLQRVLATDPQRRDWVVPRTEPRWLGQAVVTLVFASVIVLGWWTAEAPRGSAEQGVYLALLSICAAAMMLRTVLFGLESQRAQARAWTDALTGVGNLNALDRRLTELSAATHRLDAPFMLAVVDLDGFGARNATHGRDHCDGILSAVARALTANGRTCEVFRMSGDEFAVVVPGVHPEDADVRGRELAEAVVACAGTTDMTASVGIACCPASTCDPAALVRNAMDACVWVKRHGGARVAVYDQRLRAALAVDDRLRPSEDHAGVDMARALAAAADARDPAHYHHSRNVGALAVLLAAELGFEREHIDRIQVAATLHDVGKIALPDTMLGGRVVTVRQRREEQEHAAMGQRLLESLHLDGVPEWVRSHHERWDGQGYPDGLRGTEIPLESRIIALADAYEGMTAGKRYGAPMSKGAALQEIDLGIGVRFDPDLAEAFIRVVGSTSALGWADGWPAA